MAQNVRDLKQALNARSHTATLEELQSRGRRSVRVIRAADVAQMIEAAVGQTIARSGLMSPQEVDELEAKSREQFHVLLERRQAEIAELRQAADELRGAQEEVTTVQAEREAALSAAEKLRRERDAAFARVAELEEQRDAAVERLRVSELQREELTTTLRAVESQISRAHSETTASAAGGVSAELVYRLMGEIADLRARTASTATAAPAADASAADAIAGALQQLTSTFTAKLDSLGRKMGVSSAVEADAPDLAGLFKHQDGVKLESNMDNVSVKAKNASGIAANLERLKKLKGGG